MNGSLAPVSFGYRFVHARNASILVQRAGRTIYELDPKPMGKEEIGRQFGEGHESSGDVSLLSKEDRYRIRKAHQYLRRDSFEALLEEARSDNVSLLSKEDRYRIRKAHHGEEDDDDGEGIPLGPIEGEAEWAPPWGLWGHSPPTPFRPGGTHHGARTWAA